MQGYSGSDVAHVASEALLRPLRKLEAATHWVAVGGLLQPCSSDNPGALKLRLTDISPHEVSNVWGNTVPAELAKQKVIFCCSLHSETWT